MAPHLERFGVSLVVVLSFEQPFRGKLCVGELCLEHILLRVHDIARTCP